MASQDEIFDKEKSQDKEFERRRQEKYRHVEFEDGKICADYNEESEGSWGLRDWSPLEPDDPNNFNFTSNKDYSSQERDRGENPKQNKPEEEQE